MRSQGRSSVVAGIVLLAGSAHGAYTERVSVGLAGVQANAASQHVAYVSPDGRYVVFGSNATNLGLGSPYGSFLRDRATGTTTRIAPYEAQAVSADFTLVAFGAFSGSLVPGDTNGHEDIFVYDRFTQAIERVSVASGGAQALGGDSNDAQLSADGRYVAFRSGASNLVPGDTNFGDDIFVHDRVLHMTERVNVATGGAQTALGATTLAYAMSPDAHYVAFLSRAGNLAAGGVANAWNVYVRDRVLQTTELVSRLPDGSSPGITYCCNGGLAITPDGRYVAFIGDLGGPLHTYAALVRDRQLEQTVVASVATTGSASGAFATSPSISDDGRFVGFSSNGFDLIAGDVWPRNDVYVRDLLLGTTTRVDVATDGTLAEGASVNFGKIAGDGRSFVFVSTATTLVPNDSNGAADVFARDLACGDGVVGGFEACDDGGNANGDGCDLNCTISACGNGIIGAGEVCDDGAANGTDACCSAVCALVDADGDGVCDAADACTASPLGAAKVGIEALDTGNVARFGLRGRVAASAPLDPPLDPSVNGVRATVRDAIGRVAIDLAVAGGAGWSVNDAHTVWKYVDPAMTTAIKIQDRSAVQGQVRVAIKARGIPYAGAQLPLTVALFLHPPDGSSGECGEARLQCIANGDGRRIRCH